VDQELGAGQVDQELGAGHGEHAKRIKGKKEYRILRWRTFGIQQGMSNIEGASSG